MPMTRTDTFAAAAAAVFLSLLAGESVLQAGDSPTSAKPMERSIHASGFKTQDMRVIAGSHSCFADARKPESRLDGDGQEREEENPFIDSGAGRAYADAAAAIPRMRRAAER